MRSVLTFALLKDTGWYQYDQCKADKATWAVAAGCDVATQKCMTAGTVPTRGRR